jgi:hypothetical protein
METLRRFLIETTTSYDTRSTILPLQNDFWHMIENHQSLLKNDDGIISLMNWKNKILPLLVAKLNV